MKTSPAIPAEPTAAGPAALDYAPRPPAHRRRWFRRMVLALALLVVAIAAIRWGRQAVTRAVLLYHQRGCLNYAAPPDQVVFDSDPVRVANLASEPEFVISRGCAFRRLPGDWEAVTAAVPASWGPGTRGPGIPRVIAFLHERHVPGGPPRLVSVEREEAADVSVMFINGYDSDSHAMEPATATRPLRDFPSYDAVDVLDTIGPHLDLRIFAGQPDPADAAHFTIRFESGGATHIIDGYLGKDDRITLTRRHEAGE